MYRDYLSCCLHIGECSPSSGEDLEEIGSNVYYSFHWARRLGIVSVMPSPFWISLWICSIKGFFKVIVYIERDSDSRRHLMEVSPC